MAKRKPTPRQEKYIEARARGLGRPTSAIIAGSNPDQAHGAAGGLEKSQTVKEQLAEVRKAMAINSGVTKEDVVEMLKSAAEMGQMQGDVTGLVSAARELGKMLGFYAPEVKKTLLGVDQASLKKALQDMGEEELLKIANSKAIEGEFIKIEDKS